MMTDTIADMLTRIRNANRIERAAVDMPASKLKLGLAEALRREGFIHHFQVGRAGLDESVWRTLTGHSMRVGAAQDLMCAGRDILVIMTAGGWTSMNVVGRYVREAQMNVWG